MERGILVRQALYRFYAGLLLYPEAERLETLKAGAAWLAEALNDEESVGDLAITEQVRAVVAWAASLEGGTELENEWVRLFGASRDGFCFPYEGAYRGPEAAGPLLAHLQKEYSRAGLVLSTGDLPDHVAVELEYMSYLCGLELETLRSGDDARRGRIVKAQHHFLERHLCQWLPALLERLVSCSGGRFALVCEAAGQLSNRDRERLGSSAGDAPLVQ